jgi:hypothetical protein
VILTVLASASMLAAAAILGSRLTPRGIVASLVAFCLLGWATCVALVGFAGLVLRNLSPALLAALPLCLLLASVALGWRRGWLPPLLERLRAGITTTLEVLRWPPAMVVAGSVVLLLAWRGVLALRLPVVDLLGWQYHLVFADVWLQGNALVDVPQNQWTEGWPAAGELFTTWLMAISRTDALAGFTAIAPIPLAVLGTIGIARRLGASRELSVVLGGLAGMTPAVSALAGTTYPDTAFAALVVAAWYLGLRIVDGERDRSAALQFGLAAGLALGTKVTSVVLVAPIGLAVVVCYGLDVVRRRRQPAAHAAALALLVAPVVLFGLTWYVKNWVAYGNPLHPAGFGPFAGLPAGSYGAPPVPEELRGMSALEQVLRSWLHDWQQSAYAYNGRPGGFGRAWTVIAPMALAGASLLAWRRSYAALGLLVAPTLLALVVLTSPWYARYTLFVPMLGAALAAPLLDRVRGTLGMLAQLAILGLAVFSLGAANLQPNVPMRAVPRGDPGAYVGFVLGAPDEERALIGLAGACSERALIPAGARVLVARQYFVPHAVVGPDLDRVLVQPPIGAVGDAGRVLELMQAAGADWLVSVQGTRLDGAAAASDRLVLRAATCHRGNLWKLLPAG